MTVENSVIKCESVFKIFGSNPEKMLKNNSGNVDSKAFQEAGYIVGVNNASFLSLIHISEPTRPY